MYVGRGVPNPLSLDMTHGQASIKTSSRTLALTKLNYNACAFADGVPITLKFADDVGEVLTAGAVAPDVPLPFMYYIGVNKRDATPGDDGALGRRATDYDNPERERRHPEQIA